MQEGQELLLSSQLVTSCLQQSSGLVPEASKDSCNAQFRHLGQSQLGRHRTESVQSAGIV